MAEPVLLQRHVKESQRVTMDGYHALRFGDMELQLLPEHAVWCPANSMLCVADLHLGKEQTFRAAGIPIPDVLLDDLARLTRILHATSAKHLFILGDLIHAKSSRSRRLDETFTAWRAKHESVSITLVRGNHDQRAGDPSEEWRINCVNAPASAGELKLTHHPLFDGQSWNLAGHLHPKWRLRSRAEDLKLPCYLIRRRTLVLPAFGRFIDHGVILPEAADDIHVVADGTVFPCKSGEQSER